MNVRIRYFAAFRESVGLESESVNTDEGTPARLFRECQARHPSLQNYTASLVAINDEMADWDSPVSDGDEVLFFPPVAGG